MIKCIRIFCLLLTTLAVSEQIKAHSLNQTKRQLQQLDNKITTLKQTINTTHTEQQQVQKKLTLIEIRIKNALKELHIIEVALQKKQEQIKQFEIKIKTLQTTLLAQQQLLAKQIRARYAMKHYPPFAWLFNPNKTQTQQQRMVLYGYIMRSRQQCIQRIHDTKLQLAQAEQQLEREVRSQKQLQQQLYRQQLKLMANKKQSVIFMQQLSQLLTNKQHTLLIAQQDRAKLADIIIKLTQQSTLKPTYPFLYMGKKLPRPLQTSQHLQKINQGVVFFANEGESVKAVFAGKVVFSNWLNGYGLLLIIDHGRGFMTLYANNKSLVKRNGDMVEQGEKIALVGHTGGIKQNGLYFEIRQRGKAIPPLKWLS